MPIFTGSSFALQSLEYKPYYVIEVRFTQDPLRANPIGVNDGLNPANYSLHGPHAVSVVSVNTTADPQILKLTCDVPIEEGDWILTVANNVLSDTGAALVAPKSLSFTSDVVVSPVSELDLEADNGSLDVLRKHLSSAFPNQMPGWNAMLYGLAAGDEICRTNIFNAFDQLFLSTAEGKYLDRKSANSGISRPPLVGMSDDVFRKYVIRSTNNKLTSSSVWQILEVFYGTDSVSGWCKSNLSEPFALVDGDTLSFLVDEIDEAFVIFSSGDFDSIGSARAEEVAAVITRACNNMNVAAHAIAYLDPDTNTWRVKLYSETLGMLSSIRVIGGKANNAIEFPERIDVVAAVPVAWTVTMPSIDTIQFYTTDADVTITDVRVGDYANIYMASMPALEGSFEILDIATQIVGPLVAKVFVVDAAGHTVSNAIYNQVGIDELAFFRPTNNDIYVSSTRTIQAAQHGRSSFDIIVPATTEAVLRTEGTAAYVQVGSTITATASGANDSITFTGGNALSPGDQIIVDGVECSTDLGAIVGGVDPETNMDVGQIGTSSVRQWQLTAFTEAAPVSGGATITEGNVVQYMWGTGPGGIEEYVDPTGALILYPPTINPVVLRQPFALESFSMNSSVLPGKPVICGGFDGAGFAVGTICVDKAVCVAALGNPLGRHSMLMFDDGTAIVGPGVNGGGFATDTLHKIIVDGIDPVNATTSLFPWSQLLQTRSSYSMTLLDSGTSILFCGGMDDVDVLNSCELMSTMGVSQGLTGSMTYARMNHAAIKLLDGKVLVVGGWGKNPCRAFDYFAPPPELYDPATGKWSVVCRESNFHTTIALPLFTRTKAVLMDDGNVLVAGGTGVEILNTTTWKWHKIPGTVSADEMVWVDLLKIEAGAAGPDARYCVTGITDITSTSLKTIAWLVDGEWSNGIAKINGPQTVVTANPASFTIACEDEGYLNLDSDVTVTPMQAIAGDIEGPYLVDESGVSITGYHSTTVDAIYSGTKQTIIEVVTGVDFPEDGGWLVFEFGAENQTGPVAYSGKYSIDELRIDSSFTFDKDLPIGSTVTLLTQNGPWVPESPLLGLMFLTSSVAGRLECATAIQNNMAAGIDISIRISYPGDVGLGNAGYPVNGTTKLSDAVYIWGTDDPDTEIAAARILNG